MKKSCFCCKKREKSDNSFTLSSDEKELYSYGLKILIQWVVNITVIISIGVLSKMILECLLLLLSFMLIRKFAGGIHLRKYLMCLFFYGVILSCGLFMIKHRWFVDIRLFRVFVLFATSLLSLVTPVIHPNKKINAHEIKIYHSITIAIANTFMILSVTFLDIPQMGNWGYSLGTGVILCSILTFVGKIRYSPSRKK